MKKLLVVLMILMVASFTFAATGWFQDYVKIDVNEAGEAYYWIGADPSFGTQLQDHDFGTVTSLTITGCDMKYWSDTQDRGGGSFFWKIDNGSFKEEIWVQNRPNPDSEPNNYQGELSSLNINLLDGLSDGPHTFEIYAKSWDSGEGQGDSWLSNSGNNYIATFTTTSGGATPITLSSFTATTKQGLVELAWTTGSETENSHFLVYRDGAVIAQVDGAGTTSESNDYVVVDDAVVPGVHDYALADVSYAGVEKVHETVSVEVAPSVTAASFVLKNAYPNPFNPSVTLSMEYGVGSNSEINIYNTQGALVETLYNGYLEAGHHEFNWNASNMQSGVYIVKMNAGNTVSTQKLVLMK